MISLSAPAINQLKSMLSAGDQTRGLRLHVEKGGCAGWQYTMKLDNVAEGDEVYRQDGVAVIVDSESLPFLKDSLIDYEDSLNDTGFKVNNPNATRSCGCGTSFEPKIA